MKWQQSNGLWRSGFYRVYRTERADYDARSHEPANFRLIGKGFETVMQAKKACEQDAKETA